ncbi:MAG TPA: phosphatidylglycerophosphatase A [Terriglobales bacterium]|nr:phosphatidylglycerophosphatase A [Terriglobales bacterium]
MSTSGISPQTGNPRSRWAWLVGTFFGIGHMHRGPGTWAAGATVLLWRLGAQRATHTALIALLTAILVTLIGVPASTRVARESGIKDPGFVVIDEVAGQMFALIIAPLRWKYLLLSFILFRCFDIFKPPPLRALERLPEGIGIMVDDVGAGLYSLLVLAIVLKFWPSI